MQMTCVSCIVSPPSWASTENRARGCDTYGRFLLKKETHIQMKEGQQGDIIVLMGVSAIQTHMGWGVGLMKRQVHDTSITTSERK